MLVSLLRRLKFLEGIVIGTWRVPVVVHGSSSYSPRMVIAWTSL